MNFLARRGRVTHYTALRNGGGADDRVRRLQKTYSARLGFARISFNFGLERV